MAQARVDVAEARAALAAAEANVKRLEESNSLLREAVEAELPTSVAFKPKKSDPPYSVQANSG